MAVNGKIKLASKDGEEFWMDIKAAMLSKTIEDMLKYTDENDTEAAPLRKVDSAILRKVIEWCEHHKDDPQVPEDSHQQEDSAFTLWDAEFVKNIAKNTLLELILLLKLTCKEVANRIRGMTPKQIREAFGIDNDFAPEQEQQLHRENEWITFTDE